MAACLEIQVRIAHSCVRAIKINAKYYLLKKIEDGVRYANAGMQPYMEAQYVNIAFPYILNTGAVPGA
jgi:hypothetical protein